MFSVGKPSNNTVEMFLSDSAENFSNRPIILLDVDGVINMLGNVNATKLWRDATSKMVEVRMDGRTKFPTKLFILQP